MMISLMTCTAAVILFLLLWFVSAESQSYTIDDSKGLGRRFDGIGGISGGGATSKLLVNYPEEQRNQILDFLFKPNFGASLHILKIEIGGDTESSDGSEASHMHYSWDENYQRGYEWWLMKQAKKRNPDILLYGLPWGFPAWVGNGTHDPLHAPELTATYVVKYIHGAKTHHNLTIDFVGIWNERNFSRNYIEILRKSLDAAGLQHVRIVAADDLWEPISTDITECPSLSAAVDIIGVHYPGMKGNTVALKTGKTLWSSEDYSTFNDNRGAGTWAKMLNQNYVNGYMTSTIAWNLISSYYPGLPFYRESLMTANSPWSGFYTVDSPIWMTAHTTQFSQPGWMYTHHDEGVTLLKGGGSMVTLQSPNKKDFTIVIETMSHNHSVTVKPAHNKEQNISLQLAGTFTKASLVNVWYSKLKFDGTESILMKNLGPKRVTGGVISLSLGIDEVYTLTTLKSGAKGEYPSPPPQKPFPLPYTDDFESYREFSDPFNLAQQIGTYEVIKTASSHKNVIRQMVTDFPCNWCIAEMLNMSMNIIGNSSWSDIYVEVDAMISPVNGTSGLVIAARINKGGCRLYWAHSGVYLFVFPWNKTFEVYSEPAKKQMLYKGSFSISQPTNWITMGLLVKNTSAVGILDDIQVFNISLPSNSTKGFVGLGTADYGLADFDNLRIDTAEGGLDRIKKKLKYIQDNMDNVQ